MSKKVLITGCSGFLGSHLLDVLEKEPDLVLSGITEVTDFTSSRLKVYHVDIRDRRKVFAAAADIRPDLTFHLAAIANVGFSWKHQQLTYQVNFIGSSNVIEAIHRFSPHSRLLLMSSAELYGNCEGEACKETVPVSSPTNPYSLSKYAMEMVGNLYRRAENLDIVTVRSFNFTGPGQSDQFMASDFSHQIAEIEKGKRKPLIRVGKLDAIRDVSDVRDIARYLTVIAKKGESGEIYNLCSGNTYSIKDILDILLSFSTKDIKVVVDEDKLRPVDTPRLWGDTRLLREKFNLKPGYEIKQTLLDLLNYWRERVE
ncbi:MAG: GDP-mannose 4,6-dehydratase [Candidatus Aminicenantes bacterium]|nr:MAG: GDP-mannose 4,6-dehydratase [Candidatus Aminicenantes bacterium]